MRIIHYPTCPPGDYPLSDYPVSGPYTSSPVQLEVKVTLHRLGIWYWVSVGEGSGQIVYLHTSDRVLTRLESLHCRQGFTTFPGFCWKFEDSKIREKTTRFPAKPTKSRPILPNSFFYLLRNDSLKSE